MSDNLYIICEDGKYLTYGKEIEVYVNHEDLVAILMFVLECRSQGKQVYVVRHGLQSWHEKLMEKDVSGDFHEFAKEELRALGWRQEGKGEP